MSPQEKTIIKEIIAEKSLAPSARLIWLYLWLEQQESISHHELAQECAFTEKTIRRGCHLLNDFNFVKMNMSEGREKTLIRTFLPD